MRDMVLLCSAVMSITVAEHASAADFSAAHNQANGILSELRFGSAAHDPFSPERGSFDINSEMLFVKFGHSDNPFIDVLIPRLHVGGSINTGSRTSYVYTGFTWTYDITKQFFFEGSLGGAIHNGETRNFPEMHRNSLGCSPLFRESAALGYRFNENWSIMVTIDHLSNAGLCDQNRGLTNIGGKIGYRF